MKILFICTHNRCRSILAESVANHYGDGLIKAASAGSEPALHVHPMSIDALKRHHIPSKGLSSKSWDELQDFEPDFVITVCDKAAQEKCPYWFGMSLKAHWGLSDPSAGNRDEDEMNEAFDVTIRILINRIEKLAALLQKDPGRTELLNILDTLSVQE